MNQKSTVAKKKLKASLAKTNPHNPHIKLFNEQLSKYEALWNEVVYILKNLVEEKIEISSIGSRAKTLESFLEKVERKNYKNPFKNITDFAGVRLVFLYKSDFERIEKIIMTTLMLKKKLTRLTQCALCIFQSILTPYRHINPTPRK